MVGRRPCPAGGLQKKGPLRPRKLFNVQLTKGEGGPGNVYGSAPSRISPPTASPLSSRLWAPNEQGRDWIVFASLEVIQCLFWLDCGLKVITSQRLTKPCTISSNSRSFSPTLKYQDCEPLKSTLSSHLVFCWH